MEFTNFDEICVSLRRQYDFRSTTTELCDTLDKFGNECAKASRKTALEKDGSFKKDDGA